jgi:hypothetical protein
MADRVAGLLLVFAGLTLFASLASRCSWLLATGALALGALSILSRLVRKATTSPSDDDGDWGAGGGGRRQDAARGAGRGEPVVCRAPGPSETDLRSSPSPRPSRGSPSPKSASKLRDLRVRYDINLHQAYRSVCYEYMNILRGGLSLQCIMPVSDSV